MTSERNTGLLRKGLGISWLIQMILQTLGINWNTEMIIQALGIVLGGGMNVIAVLARAHYRLSSAVLAIISGVLVYVTGVIAASHALRRGKSLIHVLVNAFGSAAGNFRLMQCMLYITGIASLATSSMIYAFSDATATTIKLLSVISIALACLLKAYAPGWMDKINQVTSRVEVLRWVVLLLVLSWGAMNHQPGNVSEPAMTPDNELPWITLMIVTVYCIGGIEAIADMKGADPVELGHSMLATAGLAGALYALMPFVVAPVLSQQDALALMASGNFAKMNSVTFQAAFGMTGASQFGTFLCATLVIISLLNGVTGCASATIDTIVTIGKHGHGSGLERLKSVPMAALFVGVLSSIACASESIASLVASTGMLMLVSQVITSVALARQTETTFSNKAVVAVHITAASALMVMAAMHDGPMTMLTTLLATGLVAFAPWMYRQFFAAPAREDRID